MPRNVLQMHPKTNIQYKATSVVGITNKWLMYIIISTFVPTCLKAITSSLCRRSPASMTIGLLTIRLSWGTSRPCCPLTVCLLLSNCHHPPTIALTYIDKKDTYVRMLVIDFSSAFITIMIRKLTLLDLNPSLWNWILDFLSERLQTVWIRNRFWTQEPPRATCLVHCCSLCWLTTASQTTSSNSQMTPPLWVSSAKTMSWHTERKCIS